MARFPWLKNRKKTAPELPYEPPIWLGDMCNGEYYYFATKRDRLTRKLILEKAADNAKKLGMERREFLASAMGMCTSLYVINYVAACSSSSSSAVGAGDGGAMAPPPAKFCVPPEAMFDESVACGVLTAPDQFIFDVQTHWFKKQDLAMFPDYLNQFGSLFNITTQDNYILDMFCNSDTTMSVLTAWPGVVCDPMYPTAECGLPLSNESIIASRDYINGLANNTQRIVNHIQIMAQTDAGIQTQLDLMDQMCSMGVAAWKLYPGFKIPKAFTLDDDNGRAVIEHGIEIGVPLFCVHKGLPIGTFFDTTGGNHPREVGIVANDYPTAKFVIYHSAIDTGFSNANSAPPEGPFDPTDPNPTGTNALIKSLVDNGIAPNSNVYGEVGSALNQVLKDPTVAAHFFGKLMKYVGTDNVVWGTDCIIYGSPQTFIEQFRALTIPDDMQAQYGYPPLDDAQKAKIFGLNAAKIYGVDPEARRCQVNTCPSAELKRQMDGEMGERRWVFQEPGGPKSYQQFVEETEASNKRGRPG